MCEEKLSHVILNNKRLVDSAQQAVRDSERIARESAEIAKQSELRIRDYLDFLNSYGREKLNVR